MRAAILSIGDELTLGQSAETNARWISAQLATRSFLTVEHRTVADDRAAIAAAIRDLAAKADVIISTGGLGPTADDLTREALGDFIAPDQALVTDERQLEQLKRWFARLGRNMPELNAKQAQRPDGARFLPNPNGTAPGLAATARVKDREVMIFCMPGPPREMQPMFADHVAPALPRSGIDRVLLTSTVHEYGLSEAEAAARLGDLMARDRNPTVGTTASDAIISARIRCEDRRVYAERMMADVVAQVERAWHPYAFGRNDDSLAMAIGALLRQRGATLATAESCTGGLLGKLIVDVPGSSEYYLGGWVTYTNELKASALGVEADVIQRSGAVSEEVAEALARGALARSGAHFALSITGIAGPDGGSPEKPVGTVFISLARSGTNEVETRLFRFTGERLVIRDRAAKAALQMLRFAIINVASDTLLLWEMPGQSRGAADNAHIGSLRA